MTLALILAVLAAANAPAAKAPHRVDVGAYLTDVSDFDLKAGRFKADLMVWAKWLGGEAPPTISFENGEADSLFWNLTEWRRTEPAPPASGG